MFGIRFESQHFDFDLIKGFSVDRPRVGIDALGAEKERDVLREYARDVFVERLCPAVVLREGELVLRDAAYNFLPIEITGQSYRPHSPRNAPAMVRGVCRPLAQTAEAPTM